MQIYLVVIAITVVLLVSLTMLLPLMVLSYINRYLRKSPGIHGKVSSMRINLLTGKFTLLEVRIGMTDKQSGIDNLIITIPEASVKVALWKLVGKKVSASVILHNPELVFVNTLQEPNGQKKHKHDVQNSPDRTESPVKKAFEKLMPFAIDLDIMNGNVRYVDHTSKPRHDITLQNLTLEVRNLSNQVVHNSVPASITAQATLFGGTLNITIDLQPLKEFLTFNLTCELKEAELVLLNDYSRAYASIDVNAGTLSVYTEIAVKNGAFTGYLKPLLKNIDIIGAEDNNDSIFKKIWERMVAIAVQGLENNKLDQIATTIKINGRLDNPHVNVVAAIGGVLKNAFIKAIQPSFQNALGLKSIVKSAVSGSTKLIKRVLLEI